jgi:hypothetical protein
MIATPLNDTWDVPIGAPVDTADGQRLGYILSGDTEQLEVGGGFLFTHTYTILLSDVDRYEDGVVLVVLTMEQAELRRR